MNGFDSYEKALYTGDVEAAREMENRYDEYPELAELDRHAAARGRAEAAERGLRTFNGVAARTAGVVGSLATGNLPLASAIVGAGGAAGNLAEGGTVGEALAEGAVEGAANYAGGKLMELAGKGIVAGARRVVQSIDDSLTWGGGTVDAADIRVAPRRRPAPAVPSGKAYPSDEQLMAMYRKMDAREFEAATGLKKTDFAKYIEGKPAGQLPPSDAEMSAMARAFGESVPTTDFTPPWRTNADVTRRWYEDLTARYGKDRADGMLDVLFDENFRRYFYGQNPQKTLADIDKYREMRRIVNAVTEPNEIILGGSAGISSEGTIFRGSAVPHDLDFVGYLDNASRRTDYGSEAATRAMVEALSDRARIENSPIIRKLREMYPEARNATFHWPAYDWEIGDGFQYTPGVFTVVKASPDVAPGGHVSRTISTMLGGNKVDIMLQDGALGVSRTNPRLGNTETAFDWKRAYGAQRRKGLRPKDAADIGRYADYSEDNPVVDLGSHRAQYNPFAFADDLVNRDGMPTVFDMETYPGSGERVPVVMNTEGVILPLERPRLLETYDPMHPQNMARYANSPATAETHPLVAIRGADRAIRDAPGYPGGEYSPHIGIYPADKPEKFVDSVFEKGAINWFTNPDGTYKDIVVFPRKAVDPATSVSNRLWDEDAYTYTLDRGALSRMSERDQLNIARTAAGRRYGWASETPFYTEIGNAYRNRIYERNPWGVAPDMKKMQEINMGGSAFDGYGESMPTGFAKDGLVIRGEEIGKDPASARKKLLDAIMQMRFAAPAGLSVGIGAGAASTQQASKGGEAGPGKRESTAPTDEQLQEAAAFLRLVIEKGFAKTDDEIEKCERLARAIEAAVGAEPVKPKEAPIEARPLRPTAETQAAIDAGKADEDEDLFGRNGTVETTEQDVEDFKADADKDLFGRNGTVETTAQDVEDFKSNADRAAAQPAAPVQEQPAPQVAVQPQQEQPAPQVAVQPQQEQPAQQAAVQPRQEQLAPGLARSGSRSNILEFNGRRISQREFDRIQAKFLEGGGAQQPQAARPVQQPQVAANGADDALKPNNLRQSTQVDSGRKDALGRPLDEYGRVIA